MLLVVSQAEVWRFDVAGGRAGAAALLAAVAVASAWRTRFPLSSTAALFLLGFLCAALVGPPGSATLALALILGYYRIGTLPDRRRAYAALGVALLLSTQMVEDATLNTYLALTLASFVVPWLAGTLRLRQQRAREMERERERAIEEERARLARELHDLVSHNVGMIVVQAGAGDVLLDQQPERAREALHAIESGARDALLELRRLLGLLRDSGEAELAPRPTLARLEELTNRVRAAGIDVSLRLDVDPSSVDAAVDLSAYRIVQEALTNVVKHAQAARVDVSIRRSGSVLEIEVADDGLGAGAHRSGGHGLAGIGERVALLGGELEAGAREGGGFRVRALLPAPTTAS